MPHPEDLVDPLMGGTDGNPLFDGLAARWRLAERMTRHRDVTSRLARASASRAEEYARVLDIMGRTPTSPNSACSASCGRSTARTNPPGSG